MTQNGLGTPSAGNSNNGRTAAVIIAVLVLVLIAVVATAGVLAWRLLAHDTGQEAGGDPTRPAGGTSESASAEPAPTSMAPSPVPSGEWQQVTSAKDKMTYAVPPDWKPGPDTLAGFESPSGEVSALMHGVATYGDDWCDDNWHTLVGFVTPGSISDKGSIEATATHWAKSAAQDDEGDGGNPTGSLGEPRQVKVDGGRTTATAVTATTTPLDQTCPVPSIEVTVVSVPKASGQALFVVVADRGAEGSNPDAALTKVIASVRPAR